MAHHVTEKDTISRCGIPAQNDQLIIKKKKKKRETPSGGQLDATFDSGLYSGPIFSLGGGRI